MEFATGGYIGNGVDNRWINDPGFQPDLVVIKADADQYAIFRTFTMDAGDSAYFSHRAANFANAIQAFGAEGFQVGTNATVNTNGMTYYWAAFRDDEAGDFHAGSYIGDGNDNRNITGLGFDPTIVWIKCDSATDGCFRISEHRGDDCCRFSDSNVSNCIQRVITDGFQISSSPTVNNDGNRYHYVAFCDVSQCIETGSYTGDGNDNRDITVGFTPDLVFVRGDRGGAGYLRIDTMDAGDSGSFWRSRPATNRIKAFKANGFEVGTHVQVNENGIDYYWVACKTGKTGTTSSSSSSSSSVSRSTSSSSLSSSSSSSLSRSTSTSTSSSSSGSVSSSSSSSTSSSSVTVPPMSELLALLDEIDRLWGRVRSLREKIATTLEGGGS